MMLLANAALALAGVLGWGVAAPRWKTVAAILALGILAAAVTNSERARFRLVCAGIVQAPFAWLLMPDYWDAEVPDREPVLSGDAGDRVRQGKVDK